MSKRVQIMLTAFRDGIQSAYGARVRSADYLPAVEAAARAGVRHFESGGGALFQSSFLYCGENAFDVMDAFRRAAGPDARLQHLTRGIFLVGMEPQRREVLSLFARRLKAHGVDAVRNFDALNDPRNLGESGKLIAAAGLDHEAAICVTDVPPGSAAEAAHTPEHYAALVRGLMESDTPFASLCFKDSAGTCRPGKVARIIRDARALLGPGTPIAYHTHDTAGLAVASYLAAIEAGADRVDVSLAPMSGGACQPDAIALWHALRGTPYGLDADIAGLLEAEALLKQALHGYAVVPEAARTDPFVIFYPMPGGALAANANLLREQGMAERYPQILEALGEVFSKGGGGSPVTPVSQFYVQQAYNNVVYGPWKRMAPGYARMVLGYLGATPLDPDPGVVALSAAALGLGPVTADPLGLAELDQSKSLLAAGTSLYARGLPPTDENKLIALICGEKGMRFLEETVHATALATVPGSGESAEAAVEAGAADAPDGPEEGVFTVTVNGKPYAVVFHGDEGVDVNGVRYAYAVKPGIDGEALAAAAPGPAGSEELRLERGEVLAPMPGTLVRVYKRAGDKLAVGETVAVLETMSEEVAVNSAVSGIVSGMLFQWGDRVEAGQALAEVAMVSHGSDDGVSQAHLARVREGGRGVTVLESPLHGVVLTIHKAPGDRVNAGESIMVTESMKMQTPINSPIDGIVERKTVKQGEQIKPGNAIAAIAGRR